MPRRLLLRRRLLFHTLRWLTRITYYPEPMSGTRRWKGAFGKSDVVTVTYLGAAGRKLMRQDIYIAPNPEFTGEFDLMRNDADSSYNALQAQYRHRFSHGLQTLLSYTWAHSIDDASSDAYFVNLPASDAPLSDERGSSDYDIRQTFSGAVSYNIPAPGSGIWKSIFGNWSTDSIVYARTAPPVNVVTGLDPFNTGVLSGAYGATASESGSRSAALDFQSERSRRKGNQSSGIHDTHRRGARRSGTKCPARIRRYARSI